MTFLHDGTRWISASTSSNLPQGRAETQPRHQFLKPGPSFDTSLGTSHVGIDRPRNPNHRDLKVLAGAYYGEG